MARACERAGREFRDLCLALCFAMGDSTRLGDPVHLGSGNAIVTGGSRGIGLSVVKKLLALPDVFSGTIYVLSRTPPPFSRERVKFVPVDLTNLSSVRQISKSIPNVHLAVLNAVRRCRAPSYRDAERSVAG
jgi:NAD(P)-dependent dehydrogenase (short-subunit alcohol dehydrogenase family)